MRVYRDYDRSGLDDQYNLRRRVADAAEHVAHRKAASARVRDEVACRTDIAYGERPAERLDIFPPSGPAAAPAPALIYIHGGYWQLSDKFDTNFVALAVIDAEIYPWHQTGVLTNVIAIAKLTQAFPISSSTVSGCTSLSSSARIPANIIIERHS